MLILRENGTHLKKGHHFVLVFVFFSHPTWSLFGFFLIFSTDPSLPPSFFTMFRTKSEQRLWLIHSLLLHPCFTTTEADYLQRSWLIHRGTNTANYSLMSPNENKFSRQDFPTPMSATAPIIAGWIRTAEHYPNSSWSIGYLCSMLFGAQGTLKLMIWH